MKNKIKYILGVPIVILLVNFLLKTSNDAPLLFFVETLFLGLLIIVAFFMISSLSKRRNVFKYIGICSIIISCIFLLFNIIAFNFYSDQDIFDAYELIVYSSISFFGLLVSLTFFLIDSLKNKKPRQEFLVKN